MVYDSYYLDGPGPLQRNACSQACDDEVPPQFAKVAADNLLAVAVRQALEASGHIQVSRVTVLVHKGVFVLRGTVSLYYFKQVAQEAALRVARGEELRNEIAVISEPKGPI